MRQINCHFKNITDKDKSKFKKSSCLLTISVGQESHEDERFIATMKLISETFSSCIISLHDSLQKHTIAIAQSGNDADFFHDMAVELGDKWLKRNEKNYVNFIDHLTIIRWNDWLNDHEFSSKKNMVLAEIDRDEKYKELFDSSIDEYLNRYSKRLERSDLFNRSRAEKICFDYLVEECAVLCLWPKTKCQFEIYAGTHNAAMQETRERLVRLDYPELIQSISIGFNHRPDLKPQQFIINNAKKSN